MTLRLVLPEHIAPGFVIGHRFCHINDIQERTGTTIRSPSLPGDREFKIYGDDQNARDAAADYILKLANEFAKKKNLPSLRMDQLIAPPLSSNDGGATPRREQFVQGAPPPQKNHFGMSGLPCHQLFVQGRPPPQLMAHAHGGTTSSQHDHWPGVPSAQQVSAASGPSTPLHVDVSRSSTPHHISISGPTTPHRSLSSAASSPPRQIHPVTQHPAVKVSVRMNHKDSNGQHTGMYYEFSRLTSDPELEYRCASCQVTYEAEKHVTRAGETILIINPDKNHAKGPNCEFWDGNLRNATKRPSASDTASGPCASKSLRMNTGSYENPANRETGKPFNDISDDAYVLDSGFVGEGLDVGGAQWTCGLGGGGPQHSFGGTQQTFSGHSLKHSQSGDGDQRCSSIPVHNADGGSWRSASPVGDFQLEQQVDVPGEHGEPRKWIVTNVVRKSKANRYINMVLPNGHRCYGFQHPLQNSSDTRCRKCNGKGKTFGGKSVWIIQDPRANHSECLVEIVHGQVIHASGSRASTGVQHIYEQPTNPHGNGRHGPLGALNGLLAVQHAIETRDVDVTSFSDDQKRRVAKYAQDIVENVKKD